MNWEYAVPFAVLGLSLAVLAWIIKRHSMLDPVANLTFPYLCSLAGLAVILLGVHCLLFHSPPSQLPLLPNLLLFALISALFLVTVIWDGIFKGFSAWDVFENSLNAVDFIAIYAAVLFLPRL